MTAEEFSKIPFKMVSHISMEHACLATYVNEELGIQACKRTERKGLYDFGETHTTYKYKDVTYDSADDLLEAFNSINGQS